MLNLSINNVKISGISVVVPQKELCLTDDKTLYNGNEKQLHRVMKSSGFCKRRVVENNTTSSDLCKEASEILFSQMGVNKDSIEGIVFVSQTPDYHMPATACILQHRLKLPEKCLAFDINQGCAGYTYGLFVASSLINSGCKKILLLVGDTSSKYTDMFKEHSSAPIFGDAGSATLLEYDNKSSPIFFDIGTDGSNYDAIISENGCFRNIPSKDMFYEDGSFKHNAKMDGMKVMEFTLSKVPCSIKNVLSFANKTIKDIDYFVMHQANKFILENIAMNTGIPLEKMPMETLSKYGNQSCTSIPSAICDALQSEVSSKKIELVLSGFGIGLSWVSVAVTLDKIFCTNINEYRK